MDSEGLAGDGDDDEGGGDGVGAGDAMLTNQSRIRNHLTLSLSI